MVDGKDGKQLDVNIVHKPAAGTMFLGGTGFSRGETLLVNGGCYCFYFYFHRDPQIGMKITVQNPFLFT